MAMADREPRQHEPDRHRAQIERLQRNVDTGRRIAVFAIVISVLAIVVGVALVRGAL